MRRAPARFPALAGLAALALIAGCTGSPQAPRSTSVKPAPRPVALGIPAPEPEVPVVPSQRSRDLERYYARLQRDQIARGLLRTDGGGPDTPYTSDMLIRNFESIALEEEYERGRGLRPASADAGLGPVKKWVKPVRMTVEFGANVPDTKRSTDLAAVSDYAARLGRVTGHPVSMAPRGANFHVLVMSEDDADTIAPRIREIVPDADPASLRLFDNLPRSIHCLVIAFADQRGGYEYGQAIAVIRSEHPDLLRLSCIHEEVAQGLGLADDSPQARPSIFNDDDEFALLTSLDELLLQMLYDPALRPGMSAEEARPIYTRKARELMGETVEG
ncbi:DUF2927 domain-containing protein [Allosediminivita pacifica]|uniref:DUF2927 domain-containing protein n=1 Tax=Allosediminivita pacifica TaxID=1267769 RepID=A0A2T6AXD3_9RHOB|nr:DUF2927 domain-containing protein [Allosediminivita pacifica]PTX48458.1 hypothetical protein C8N44_109151 [Allosediminivita pacifica]GGB10361.1 hypothetical protein GCM10011324_20500 [Allosediminivita pacifica]